MDGVRIEIGGIQLRLCLDCVKIQIKKKQTRKIKNNYKNYNSNFDIMSYPFNYFKKI